MDRLIDAGVMVPGEVRWANAAGVYAHPADKRSGEVEEGFRGWGRVISNFDTGLWSFETVKPGVAPGRTQQELCDQLDVVGHHVDATDVTKA